MIRSIRFLSLTAILTGCTEYELESTKEPPSAIDDVPPCIVVEPTSIAFGALTVTEDAAATEVVTVKNECEGDLEIYGLELKDASAPFAIGTIGSVLLPQNSETDFTVTFDPQTSGTWSTKVLIESNDPDIPTEKVSLTGEGIAPIIEVTPEDYDFGTPYIGCELEQPYNIANIGTADLIVDGLTLTTPSTTEFTLDTYEEVNGALPFTVAPGNSLDVYLQYLGLDEFADSAYVSVASNDPWTPSVTVSATGIGTLYGKNTDIFEQPSKSSTDILFVVDNSCSMWEEQTSLAGNFESFIDTLTGADADYQLAVITTDNYNFRGDIISPASSDPVGEFQSQAVAGTTGSGTEKGLEMAYNATQSGGDAGPGSTFLRDKSMLAIVVLTDEPDYSAMNPEDYVDYWWDLKDGDTDLVRVHAIAGEVPTPSCSTAYSGTGYDEAVSLTGGEFVSICTTDWGASLETLALGSVAVANSYELTQEPVPQTIQVKVDGVKTSTGWEYDAGSYSVVFESDHIPAAGSTVEITYHVMPDCEG